MTLFEYLAVAFSLIFSASAMRLVGGLPHAFDVRRRYWVHVGFVLIQLLATLGMFWGFWSFRDMDWTLGRFTLALAGPSLTYFNACALIPENPETVASWRDHYYEMRRRYFGGYIAWAACVVVSSTALVHMTWSHPARVVQGAVLVMGFVGCASARPRVHAGLVLVLAGVTLVMFAVLARPAPLAS